MTESEELLKALSLLTELVHTNPDEALKKVKTDLLFGLVAFIPKETLSTSDNGQLYVKTLESARQEILTRSLAELRRSYNEGFILAGLISFFTTWSKAVGLKGELQEVSARLEELMRSTESEFIKMSCDNALRDMRRRVVAEEMAAALSVLKELVPANPDEAFRQVKSELAFGLVAFKPQETLKSSDNVQLYINKLEAAQQQILQDSIAVARLKYNEGFILSCLVASYRTWSSDVDLKGELHEFTMRLEELMQSTKNEFIEVGCLNALRDMNELESYISEQSELYYPYLVCYYSVGFDPEYISDLLFSRELPEIKVFGFLLAIYRNNRYLRTKLQELVGADQISFVLVKVLEGIEEFTERAAREDLRKLASGFLRAEKAKKN